MKSLLICFICFISFAVSGQTNKQDSFTHSITCNGYLSGNTFVNRVAVITVDFYDMTVTVMGTVHSFTIVSKYAFFDATTLTVIQYSDTGELASIAIAIAENKEKVGFYAYYTFQSKMYFEVSK